MSTIESSMSSLNTENSVVIPPVGRRSALLAFVLLHVLLAGAGVSWAMWRVRAIEAEKVLPPFLAQPLTIGPLYDVPEAVSDEQLKRVLYQLRPRFRVRNPKINHVDHALRFWGIEAVFDDPECLSGVEMRELLLDHRQFAGAWEAGTRSLLINTLHGVRPRVQEGDATSSHVDHTVATLAEVGTPLDYPVLTADGETTFQAMLEHARRDFSLNQVEYEWTAMVFALYCPTDREWMTDEGQWISFDRLADRIMRQRLTQGVCFGNHRLYSLALLLRVDEQQRILSEEARIAVLNHLKQVTDTLVASQHEAGYWDRNWDGTSWDPSTSRQPAGARRILATGHALEWWAIAPEEVQPPQEVVVRACRWLANTIDALSEQDVQSQYTFLSHAGRALALWRGRTPAEVVGGSR
jgi:hypothetical protein